MNDDDLDQLAADVRRQWGDRLPVPVADETPAERELREEITRDVLDSAVLPELDQQRIAGRLAPLTRDEQATLVDLVISELFGLPRLLNVLRDPLVTDVLVFGSLRAQFWVCGRFDVRDGRIELWRDSFDFVDITRAFLRGLAGMVLPGVRPPAPSSADDPPGR